MEQIESHQAIQIYTPSPTGSLRQGEILSDLKQFHLDLECLFSEEKVYNYEEHPYAIIVTQDCDLEQDYRNRINNATPDKLLPNILFCQMIKAQNLKNDNNLFSKIWDRVKINKDERYHFFQKIESIQDQQGEGLPELGVDFKRYFTLPTDEVYCWIKADKAKRRCCLQSPYLEHFSTRFAYYQFRVALPADHLSE